MVHWPLNEVDAEGHSLGSIRPVDRLGDGMLRDLVLRDGPDAFVSAPQSGTAWKRTFLDAIEPLRRWMAFVAAGLTLHGKLGRGLRKDSSIAVPQGFYRLHGANNHSSLDFERKLASVRRAL